MDPDYAVKEIRNESGAQFDPQCVEAFLQYLSEKKTTENKPAKANEKVGSA
jgi:HD-GYP domain-containing protein (c-di-GMP phosphodiesterase class II)